jgi:hypothetical protein
MSVIVMAMFIQCFSLGEPSTGPISIPTGGSWKLSIGDASESSDGMYYCMLTWPKDLPINEEIGIVLTLVDRNRQTLGVVHLAPQPFEGGRAAECRLAPELIKNSYILLQIHPNTKDVKIVKLVLGDQQALRRAGGSVVREAIK